MTKSRRSAQALVDRLKNSDIRWDGTLIGLFPRITGEEAHELLALGEEAVPPLIDALDDESKFVAAHVLLTLLSDDEYETSPWNGLEIELGADGEPRVDPARRFELAKRWRARLGA